jgi:serine protease Do
VEKGSPADKGGIEATDIITRFDGKEVESSSDLPRIVGGTRPGTRVPVEVWRKSAPRMLSLTVGELLEERVAALETPRAPKAAPLAANRLGLVVSELSAEQKRELKLAHGLVVTDVRSNARAELRRGDVLLKLVHNGQHTDLKSTDQLDKLLAGLENGAVFTLQVRRGESTAFITVAGLGDKG